MGGRFSRALLAAAFGGLWMTGAALVTTAGTASALTGGTENFTVVATANQGEGPGTFVGSGAFSAVGTDYEGGSVDKVVLPNGTFKILHDLPGGTINVTIDPVTCILTLTGSGIPFVIEKGTGTYRGISGTGTVSIDGHQVLARNANGKCSHTATPLGGVTVFGGTAQISFGNPG